MELDSNSSEKVGDVFRMESTVTLDRQSDGGKDDYDPFQHRNVAHPTSTYGSFFHLLKSSLGSGLLAMPAAFKHTGLIPGFIGTMVVAIIATHCVHILVKTSRDICKECRVGFLSYTDTCVKVFKHGPRKLRTYTEFVRHFVDYAMAGVCLGGTSVYVIFIASSLKNISDYLYPGNIYPVELYCGILLLPLILLTQVRHLKFLVPFSIFANLCLLVTFAVTCYYTFQDVPSVSNVKLFNSVQKWPLFLRLALAANVLVTLAVFFTYFLQMYAPMDIMWTRLKERISARFHNQGQILMRTLSVTLTVVLAAAVPDLELLIGLVGAVFFSTLGLFIPLVVQTVHKWDRGLGMFSYILWKNTLLLAFYVLVLVSGCYSAVTAIIARFTNRVE